jgi:hypothetical protein
MFVSETFHFYGICRKNKEPTSGLEPLTCSLRVIGQPLQGCAGACKSRISKRLSLLRLAVCCTVLRSRWYQSGINTVLTVSVIAFHNKLVKPARRDLPLQGADRGHRGSPRLQSAAQYLRLINAYISIQRADAPQRHYLLLCDGSPLLGSRKSLWACLPCEKSNRFSRLPALASKD